MCLTFFHLSDLTGVHAQVCLTSVSDSRPRSSCRLSLMRARLFFSTSGFLVCSNKQDFKKDKTPHSVFYTESLTGKSFELESNGTREKKTRFLTETFSLQSKTLVAFVVCCLAFCLSDCFTCVFNVLFLYFLCSFISVVFHFITSVSDVQTSS